MNNHKSFSLHSKRQYLIISISLLSLLAMFFVSPIAQDIEYHQFADQNSYYSIPHFWNVISNLPFLLVGVIGITQLLKIKTFSGVIVELKATYVTFFIGVFLTGIGSAYYHWLPNNSTLLWDRLPMTISFMAFFVIIVGENISVSLARKLFYPLILIGVFSVFYWMYTESIGAGDLRLYVLVQFLPIVLIPLILWLYPSAFKGQRYIVYVIVAYILAKLAEQFDQQILDFLRIISGHAIKHVIAAVGTYYFYIALRKRVLVGDKDK